MKIAPCVDFRLPILAKECGEVCNISLNEWFQFSLFNNALMYWGIIIVEISPEKLISFWGLSTLPWKYSSYYTCLNSKVTKLDCTSPPIPPICVSLLWISLDSIAHPNILWAWVVKTLYYWGDMGDLIQVQFFKAIKTSNPGKCISDCSKSRKGKNGLVQSINETWIIFWFSVMKEKHLPVFLFLHSGKSWHSWKASWDKDQCII